MATRVSPPLITFNFDNFFTNFQFFFTTLLCLDQICSCTLILDLLFFILNRKHEILCDACAVGGRVAQRLRQLLPGRTTASTNEFSTKNYLFAIKHQHFPAHPAIFPRLSNDLRFTTRESVDPARLWLYSAAEREHCAAGSRQ